jgi:F-type H+-transporting ATPase subunit epsilon
VAGLEVHVVSPERELWSGQATMVIARGTEGEVGILRGHAPILIRLAIGPLRVQHDGNEERMVVDGGFMHVSTSEDVTRVDVLADGAALVSEIDVEAARRDREAAEERLARDRDDLVAQADLAQALARLSVTGAS